METHLTKNIYLAGPMSSFPKDFNFPAFYAAEKVLSEQGWNVFNPARMDCDCGYTLEKLKQLTPAEHQEFLKDAVKRDLAALQTCQAIAMLPGWENSKGAKAELAVAQWLGLDEVYLDGARASLGPCNADDGAVGEESELGPVDTGYSDHIKQPDADGWIPHVPGDPMPCDGSTLIDVRFQCGEGSDNHFAEEWGWGEGSLYGIVKWRPAQPKQPYNSDERAEWKATASPMDEYLCSKERIADCGKIDMGDYSSTATAQYAPDDPKGAAGAKKAPMDLLPPDALLETARAMGHGAAKYGRWNFIEAKVCAHTYVAAIGRHWAAYAKGQDDDAESGLKHLAHIAANCYILMTAAQQGTLNDDRPRLK